MGDVEVPPVIFYICIFRRESSLSPKWVLVKLEDFFSNPPPASVMGVIELRSELTDQEPDVCMAEKCVLAKRKEGLSDPPGNANCFVLKFMNSLSGKVYVWFPKTIKTKKKKSKSFDLATRGQLGHFLLNLQVLNHHEEVGTGASAHQAT